MRTHPVLADVAARGLVGGVVAGLVWAGAAPTPPRTGTAGLDPYAPQAEAFIAADGWFALVTAVVGVLTTAWLLARPAGVRGVRGVRRGIPPVTTLGWRLVLTGVLGSLAAWGVGVGISPTGLRALGVLCAWPIASLATLVVVVLTRRSLAATGGAPAAPALTRAGPPGPAGLR